ncbi:MAG: mannan-binding lectin [Rhodospirillales bacterium]|nr:mannan-binding lectin [Rhodospirillales bacterium]
MGKLFAVLTAALIGFGSAPAMAQAFTVPAGPIWNNSDAGQKCPTTCSGVNWNGQWWTTVPNQMSVCQISTGTAVPVGPIWNNQDAQSKCPSQLSKVSWDGQWWTTVPNQMSVCECVPPAPVSQ